VRERGCIDDTGGARAEPLSAVTGFIIVAVTVIDRLVFAPLERRTTRQFGGAR
jgi:hypothetical protein